MLPAKNRLTKDREFNSIFKEGRSFYSGPLGLKYLNNNLGFNRFGILVGTKVSKLAVKRNLYKRRLRAVITGENKHLKQGFDLVVITKPEIKELSYSDLIQSLSNLFKKSGLK